MEEKGLWVEEEGLMVDGGSLKMKGIPWMRAILMEQEGGSWKRNCGRLSWVQKLQYFPVHAFNLVSRDESVQLGSCGYESVNCALVGANNRLPFR